MLLFGAGLCVRASMSVRHSFVFVVSKMLDLGQKNWTSYRHCLDNIIIIVPVLTTLGQRHQIKAR